VVHDCLALGSQPLYHHTALWQHLKKRAQQSCMVVKHLGRQPLYHHTALWQHLSKHKNQTWSKIWEDSRSTTTLPSGSTCQNTNIKLGQTSGKTAALPPHCPRAAAVKTQKSNLVKNLGRQPLYHQTALGQHL